MDIKGLSPCWRKDGEDYICDLPELPKAIIVARYRSRAEMHYQISERSWFPFKTKEYDKQYLEPKQAIEDAQKVIMKFVSSFITATHSHIKEIDYSENKIC